MATTKKATKKTKEAPTTRRAAAAMHDAVDQAADKAEHIEQRVRASAAETGERLQAGQQAAADGVARSVSTVEQFVNERPLAAAGIAFAAGVVFTNLLRRR